MGALNRVLAAFDVARWRGIESPCGRLLLILLAARSLGEASCWPFAGESALFRVDADRSKSLSLTVPARLLVLVLLPLRRPDDPPRPRPRPRADPEEPAVRLEPRLPVLCSRLRLD